MRSAIVPTLVAAALALTSVSTQQNRRSSGIVYVNGRAAVAGDVLVKFRTRTPGENRVAVESQLDADDAESLGPRNLRRIHSRGLRTEDLLATLAGHPDVEYAEPNYLVYALRPGQDEPFAASVTPNDAMFSSLWGLLNTGQTAGGQAGTAGDDIKATTAWSYSTGSRANVVGVVDTGIDYNHPDLAANVWSAPSQFTVTISGQTITCAAGTHGFNAINNTCDPLDDNDHGSHCSGTIGGVGNNSTGVAGVNWTASIMGLKFLGSSGSGSTSDAIKAVEFAIQAKAQFGASANIRVLSNSWGGGGFSQAMLDEITLANSRDMLFVAAAGNASSNNDATPAYPANYVAPNMLTVAATDNRDQLASFSNYGATTVHLGAPGVAILSTTRNNSYSSFNGTSMATPHVAGAAALLLAKCPMTTAALKSLILSSLDPASALSGKTTTGGRLNVGRAMQTCVNGLISSASVTPDVAAPQPPGTTVTWTATASGGTAPYQYQWLVYDGTNWPVVQAWSSSNTFVWTPTTNNANYQVGVWTRSAGNNANQSEKSAASPFAITQATVSAVSLSPNLASPQRANTTIRWTATPTGGVAPIQYQWLIYNGSAWTLSGSWTSSNTFDWTPNLANANYQVGVWTRSAGNLIANSEKSAAVPYVINPAVVTSVTLSPSIASPQPVNTAITWTATPAGGSTPYQYQWLVFDGTTWYPSGVWTTSNTYVWTPSTANSAYQVGVWTRSAGNVANQSEKSAAVPYTINARVSTVALTPSLTAPQPASTTVTFTAVPSGGTAPYQYQWLVYDGASWNTVGVWTTTNTLSWTPTQTNSSYQVGVWTRSAGNGNNLSEKSAAVAFPIQPRIGAVSLTPNYTAPVPINTSVTWTATPSGGVSPYQYLWLYFDGTNWITLSSWTTQNTWTWIPSVANASTQFGVWTRSANNTNNQSERSAAVAFASAARVTTAALAADKTAPQPAGTTITWTATPSGGTAPYQYQWLIYDGTTWNFSGSWTASNTFAWTPSQANAAYQVGVWTRSNGNTNNMSEKSAATAFAISAARVTSVTLMPDKTAPRPVGTTITWTATPSGGTAPYEYQWLIYDGTTWTLSGGWTSTSTFAWTPSQANASYQVGVWTRSAGNNVNQSEKSAAVPFAIQ